MTKRFRVRWCIYGWGVIDTTIKPKDGDLPEYQFVAMSASKPYCTKRCRELNRQAVQA